MTRFAFFRLGVGLPLLCTGCAHNQTPPPVLIPTPVACVHGDIPDEPRHVTGELTGDSGHDIGIIAGSAIELRLWGLAERGMLVACQGR